VDDLQHFFLSSPAGEGTELAQPRECWEIKRLRVGPRGDYMLISMEPPYRAPHGIGYRDVYKLLIATRQEGHSLYPIKSWPCDVYVAETNENVEKRLEIRADQVRIVAWALLFRTLPEAEAHFKKLSNS
jgi:hypothetical protein